MNQLIENLRQKIAAHGLHQIVAARLRAEGFKIAELSELPQAVAIFGQKLYEKNAQYRRIIEGLCALRDLEH